MEVQYRLNELIHEMQKRGHKREDLVIMLGYEVVYMLIKELVFRCANPYPYNLIHPTNGKLQDIAMYQGVRIRKGYENNKVVIFDEIVNAAPHIEVEIEIK